jgi:hypothetical protein
MKKVAVPAPKDETMALLADCEQTWDGMRKKGPVIADQISDVPLKKTGDEATTAKTVEKPKYNKETQKEKERNKDKPETNHSDIELDKGDVVEPKKGKGKQKGKERKKDKPETNSDDVDMDDVDMDDVEPKKGKQREAAPTKRELRLEAEIKELRQLMKNKVADESADSNADSDTDSAASDDSSEPNIRGTTMIYVGLCRHLRHLRLTST